MTARPEALLERQVLHTLGGYRDLAIFKNEVGEGFYGAAKPQLLAALRPFGPAAVNAAKDVLNRARVHYGLHVGSADLMGTCAVLITPAMVGRTIGRTVSLELKSERGSLRPEQEVWLQRMTELGAVAEVPRSPGHAALAIERARRGE